MDTKQAYDNWAFQYDTNDNKTRDLEAVALRASLASISINTCLEIGCGTGKNTEWLLEKAQHLTAVDFSDKMLAKAKERITSNKVQFIQADITKDWTFTHQLYDMVCFSLVLEHIDNIDHIFKEVEKLLQRGGYVYIGELHPFKQYSGSKARFETGEGLQVVECFTHHISDFIQAAKKYRLILADADEYFDTADRNGIPRILTILLRKA